MQSKSVAFHRGLPAGDCEALRSCEPHQRHRWTGTCCQKWVPTFPSPAPDTPCPPAVAGSEHANRWVFLTRCLKRRPWQSSLP
jgi:hypothetical protein